MDKTIVINDSQHETRVALLEDGNIVELFIERRGSSDITGNIYKGRVQRVLPGMQAAFVDVGLNQAAFIYVDDVFLEDFQEIESILNGNENSALEEDDESTIKDTEDSNGLDNLPDSRFNIEDLLVEGQDILVQVAKSPIGTKGARVTCHTSLPGRFLVLMPFSSHIGISRKIEDENERNRLKEQMGAIRDDHLGYIVRTAAEGVDKDKLEHEMAFLKNLWSAIQKKYKNAPSLSLIHQELNITLRAVRDFLLQEAEKLAIDSRSGYESILSFLDTFMPSLKDSVELYTGSEPIFDAYNLEGDISRALKRKVWLKSGGYIVIEHTEALVAIDVNTGRYVGKHNLEETILKTNLEAVKEIAYQVRLRDIGGIIIIDFIDMEKEANREKVFNALKDALRKDKSKTNILKMSELGLIEMTRKRTKESITRVLREPCFYCDGEGYLKSTTTMCYEIFREIERDHEALFGRSVMVTAHPEVVHLLYDEERHRLEELEKNLKARITVQADQSLHLEQYDIYAIS